MFPATDPLELISIEILVLLPKTKSGTQYIFLVTDRFSKLAKQIPTTKTTGTAVASIVLENSVSNLCITTKLLTGNGPW